MTGDLMRMDAIVQMISSSAVALDSYEQPIPEGVLIYSRTLREFRLGINKRWSETPVFLKISDIETLKTIAEDLAPRVDALEISSDENYNEIIDELATKSNINHTHTVANITDLLDGSNKIKEQWLPQLVITDTFEVASQSAMLALTAQKGDVAVRSDINKSFILAASPASTLANWKELKTPTDLVQSVNGKTGAVVITIADISGLQTQLDGKALSSHTHTIANITGLQTTLTSLQDQLDTSQATITGAATTIVSNDLTANRVVISNSSGKIAVSGVSASELNYLSGVTSNIQTQINSKQANLVSGTNIKTINGTSVLGSGNISISTTDSTKLPLSGGTMTGAIGSVRESFYSLGSTSGSISLNLSSYNHFAVTPTGNITSISFSGTPSSQSMTVILEVIASGTARTITWPSSIKWPGGTPPVLDWVSGRVNFIVMNTRNGGTTWNADFKIMY